MTKLDYILSILDEKIVVVPILKNSRAPAIAGWQNLTISQARTFWKKHNVNNYNYATLHTPHFCCLDIDLKPKNKKAIKFWKKHSNLFDEYYQEPSPNGIHIPFISKTPIKNSRKYGVEIFASNYTLICPSKVPEGEYTVIDPFPDKKKLRDKIKPFDKKIWKALEPYMKGFEKESSESETPGAVSSLGEIRLALKKIPADDYNTWVTVGMALHHYEHESGETMIQWFNAWSKTAPGSYKNFNDIKTKWRSFSSNKDSSITINTVFKIALEHGLETGLDRMKCKPIPKELLDDVNDLSDTKKYTKKDVHDQKKVVKKSNQRTDDSFIPYSIPKHYYLPAVFFYDCPSPIGQLTKEVCESAYSPLPGSTFAAFASLAGYLRCNRISVSSEGINPNIYFICLAPTSSGKNLPQGMLDQLIRKLHIKGVWNEVRSELSMYKALEKHHRNMYMLDEVTTMLKQITSTTAEQYKSGIVKALTQLWTYSNRSFSAVPTMSKKTDEIKVIDPKLVFLGFAQHSCIEIFTNPSVVESGFVQRFNFIIEKNYIEPNLSATHSIVVPDRVMDYFKTLQNTTIMDQLEDADIPLEERERVIKKTDITFTETATAIFDEFQVKLQRMIKKAALERDDLHSKIFGKAVEQAKRLSLALMDIDNHVSHDLATWCCDFVENQINMFSLIYGKMDASNPEQDRIIERLIKFWKILYKEKGIVTITQLRRRMRSSDSRGRGFDHYYDQAIKMGIFETNIATLKSGQKASIITLKIDIKF